MLHSALDIVNAACARIGEEPLQEWGGDDGQAAQLIYHEVVDFNLSCEPFSFAEETVQCSTVTGAAPLTGFTFVHDVPGDWFGPPLRLSDDATDPERRITAYLLQGRQIHSNCDPLFVTRRFRPEPWQWPADFRSCTIAAIAARLAIALASDEKLYDRLMTEAYGTPSENMRGGLMRMAITNDSQRKAPRRIQVTNNPFDRSWRSG